MTAQATSTTVLADSFLWFAYFEFDAVSVKLKVTGLVWFEVLPQKTPQKHMILYLYSVHG